MLGIYLGGKGRCVPLSTDLCSIFLREKPWGRGWILDSFSLRASSPFGGVARRHARAARVRELTSFPGRFSLALESQRMPA